MQNIDYKYYGVFTKGGYLHEHPFDMNKVSESNIYDCFEFFKSKSDVVKNADSFLYLFRKVIPGEAFILPIDIILSACLHRSVIVSSSDETVLICPNKAIVFIKTCFYNGIDLDFAFCKKN